MRISVARALSELKLLNSRIERATNDSQFVVAYKSNSKKVNNIDSPEEFATKAKSDYKSVNDLIERRKAIKAAVVGSNAITMIKTGDKEMSVAEAIERKESIIYEINLLQSMERQYNQVLAVAQRNNDAAQPKLDALLQTLFEKDVDGKLKGDADQIKLNSDRFWEQNKYIILDELKLGNKIKALKEDIDTFNANVDFALSESNVITMIEIPD